VSHGVGLTRESDGEKTLSSTDGGCRGGGGSCKALERQGGVTRGGEPMWGTNGFFVSIKGENGRGVEEGGGEVSHATGGGSACWRCTRSGAPAAGNDRARWKRAPV
jgi:hypothetical protein